jgi:hypothetical protein
VLFFARGAHHFQPLAKLDATLIGGMTNIAEEVLSTLAQLTA